MPSYRQERLAQDAPRLDYALNVDAPGRYRLDVSLLPTQALSGKDLRFGVSLDDGAPGIVALPVKDGGADWAQGVLNAKRRASTLLNMAKPGPHTLHIYGVDAGVVLDDLSITKEN